MKFSLLIELQIESPTAASERQAFLDCVEQAVLADELGYHCLWAVEHHGLYEYSHCSAPEVLLAYIAGRTRRIRLGHAVTLTPHRYNHPIRIAERVATLGILSESDSRQFSLTPLGAALKADAPGAARSSVLTIASDWWFRGFGELMYSVQTSKSGFEKALGEPIFDYLGHNPEDASLFSETMIGFHGAEPPAVAAAESGRFCRAV